MKKLLLILLLLFPVHGAWAKDKIQIKCIDDGGRMTFIIDLEKNTMTNSHGVFFRNVSITPTVFQGDIHPHALSKTNEQLRTQGSPFLLKNQTYRIYRDDGLFNVITEFTNGDQKESPGQCEQISKKKF